jgi:hypothetical protein
MLLFARAGVGGGAHRPLLPFWAEIGKSERNTVAAQGLLIEHLLRLSGQADYWVVLEVTMLIFQSSP